MLSIIISSYQSLYLNSLTENIKETIGIITYEIIAINNPNLYSISEVYNKGVARSKYDNLLFIHEDIFFNTLNWGEILLDYLNNKEVGVVGVAGNTYLPNTPLGWSGLYECISINLIQSNKNKDIIKKYLLNNDKQARSLDGVFLSCRKEVALKFKFEEKIKGFHCYDFIFSNRVANNYRNVVTSKILITHYSTGKRDNKWMENLINSRQYYDIIGQNNKLKFEIKAYYYYGLRLRDSGFKIQFIIKELYKYLNFNNLNLFGIFLFPYLVLRILYQKLYNGK